MVNSISGSAVTHTDISFVCGAVVTALIYSLRDIREVHFNPAVTLAFWTSVFSETASITLYFGYFGIVGLRQKIASNLYRKGL